MGRPTPHRISEKEYDSDPRRAYDLSATAPVVIVGANGKERFLISRGVYLDDSDCEWCWDSLKTCEEIGETTGCAGPRLRRLEALVREIAEDPKFNMGSSYHFRACPFCGQWLSNGHDHHRGRSVGGHGPIVCWVHRAEMALGLRTEQALPRETKR